MLPPAVDKPEAAANGSAPAAFQDMGNIRPWVQHKGAKQQEQKQRQQQQPPQVKQQPGGPSTESIAINTPDTPKDPGPGPEEESGYVDHDGDIFYDAPSRFEGDLVHPDVRYLVQNEAIQAMIGGTSADVTAAANRNHASAQSTLSRVSNGIVRALRAARILGKTVPLPPVTIPIGRRMVVLGEDIHGLETPEALSQYLKDVELEQRQQRRPGPVDMRTALNRMYAEERLRGRGAHQNQQMRLMNALRTEKGAPIPEECLPPVQCKDVENVSSED
ncbi:hypothetical protein IWQ60_008287 [Tieghemiomyces parasiticus]|uniref:Uncharacterized protein n=1 Tax=Tieghemiomyces parasiticus TaxID=78921 RepID=A0A9W8A2B4_9FUNG|nr:hypothetical protein IWQ60_008287 [Tieghemiomyces parasiticus]